MAKNYLKQFTEWATGSKNNLFLWARLKLTLLYVTFIALIIVIFSVGLYIYIDKSVQDTISEKIKGRDAQQDAILQTETQLQEEFIIGDALLLLVVGGLSFAVAGNNLRPIQKALEKQKRFTADASHDLRTPLSIMKTDCEVTLRRAEVSAQEFHDLIKSNLEEIDHMSAMVEQLLFLSRNDTTIKYETQSVPLGKLANKMAASFQGLAKSKNISLNISEITDAYINGNQLDLERMLSNIIKNAIDYTQEGGIIILSLKKNKDGVVFSVKDNGIGIAPEDMEHITEAFYKADKVRNEEHGGSGLGLSIVEGIVEKHRGKMFIESKLGEGTEIEVTFPSV